MHFVFSLIFSDFMWFVCCGRKGKFWWVEVVLIFVRRMFGIIGIVIVLEIEITEAFLFISFIVITLFVVDVALIWASLVPWVHAYYQMPRLAGLSRY